MIEDDLGLSYGGDPIVTDICRLSSTKEDSKHVQPRTYLQLAKIAGQGWFEDIKYLDTKRILDYLKPGGTIDQILGQGTMQWVYDKVLDRLKQLLPWNTEQDYT